MLVVKSRKKKLWTRLWELALSTKHKLLRLVLIKMDSLKAHNERLGPVMHFLKL